ncbi:flavodoxin family protein [Amycolatopsis decaplanina]|uniref:Flavodoxin n=1 Tax=Amycolatopsis decaplanina DSM 44594 TaxID=1284240 RepID=M2Y0L0_9PSEU|nr:flavodoxin family protein [Amycolatopsis decaplanina]EME55060.1 flavodoxin [Amycolatopsis decaplanina DSM 44594]
MQVLVVFESMFGNTEIVARAIGKGLAGSCEVDVVNVDDAPAQWDGVGLLVVGGPTHAHGMARPATRKSARQQVEGGVRSSTGVREWLSALPVASRRVPVAVFDTRLRRARWLTGSAAVGARKLLLKRRGVPLVPPESFFVDAGKNATVLCDGEQERAEAWGTMLAARLLATAAG